MTYDVTAQDSCATSWHSGGCIYTYSYTYIIWLYHHSQTSLIDHKWSLDPDYYLSPSWGVKNKIHVQSNSEQTRLEHAICLRVSVCCAFSSSQSIIMKWALFKTIQSVSVPKTRSYLQPNSIHREATCMNLPVWFLIWCWIWNTFLLNVFTYCITIYQIHHRHEILKYYTLLIPTPLLLLLLSYPRWVFLHIPHVYGKAYWDEEKIKCSIIKLS